jgi:hypothetical protein
MRSSLARACLFWQRTSTASPARPVRAFLAFLCDLLFAAQLAARRRPPFSPQQGSCLLPSRPGAHLLARPGAASLPTLASALMLSPCRRPRRSQRTARRAHRSAPPRCAPRSVLGSMTPRLPDHKFGGAAQAGLSRAFLGGFCSPGAFLTRAPAPLRPAEYFLRHVGLSATPSRPAYAARVSASGTWAAFPRAGCSLDLTALQTALTAPTAPTGADICSLTCDPASSAFCRNRSLRRAARSGLARDFFGAIHSPVLSRRAAPRRIPR